MIFDNLYVLLACKECGCDTEHIVVFKEYRPQSHTVHYLYFCLDCQEKSMQLGITYLEYRSSMDFELWLSFYATHGEKESPS